MQYICTRCGTRFPADTYNKRCDNCGGLFDLDYTPPAWDPELIDRSEWSIFRYRRFMPIEGDAWRRVSMGEGMTPVIPLDPGSGGVHLKMDYFMPTLSFKDRGAAVLVSHMLAVGVKFCVEDSSGNAGNAVAAYCARAGIRCEIYVPEDVSPKKVSMMQAMGAHVVIVPGSRDHCADVCREQVQLHGAYYANHVFNPYFFEGTKTYIYEVFEQLGRIPANLVIPVGNGTLLIGAVKALEHLLASGAIKEFPNIIAVQSELCDPLAQAQRLDLADYANIVPEPTMAEGIAIGQPMRGREILALMKKHGIRTVTAPEDQILPCRSELARRGIYVEHTTAASLAGYRHYCELYGAAPDTLITMCGAGLKSDHT